MIRTSDIRKLSEFRQNATAHLDRLAKSGGVEILTRMTRYTVHFTEVHRAIFERTYLVFHTIDKARGRENIVSFRHGAQESR